MLVRQCLKIGFETTQSGCVALLAREDSERIRQICADHWQRWLYQFYPGFPDLAVQAGKELERHGGSEVPLQGSRGRGALLPLLGWKGVWRMQFLAHRSG